jgi:hypothetical protein
MEKKKIWVMLDGGEFDGLIKYLPYDTITYSYRGDDFVNTYRLNKDGFLTFEKVVKKESEIAA